jgi:hypothetical protein
MIFVWEAAVARPFPFINVCPPTWIRTKDLLLKREPLYRLSYGRNITQNTTKTPKLLEF